AGAPAGSGSGRCTFTHCSAETVPDALNGASYLAAITMPAPPFAPEGGVTCQVRVSVWPGFRIGCPVCAWVTVQPGGVVSDGWTFVSLVRPELVMVAVAVVSTPEVSAGCACWPGTVEATLRFTVGRAEPPS